ncbi:hypothetical protein ACOSP7_000485 [Xanthoceras sorbifolium]
MSNSALHLQPAPHPNFRNQTTTSGFFLVTIANQQTVFSSHDPPIYIMHICIYPLIVYSFFLWASVSSNSLRKKNGVQKAKKHKATPFKCPTKQSVTLISSILHQVNQGHSWKTKRYNSQKNQQLDRHKQRG